MSTSCHHYGNHNINTINNSYNVRICRFPNLPDWFGILRKEGGKQFSALFPVFAGRYYTYMYTRNSNVVENFELELSHFFYFLGAKRPDKIFP